MDNHYFVIASLPPLVLGQIPDISFKEFMELLELNLSKEDLKKVGVIRLQIDLQNIRTLYLKQPLDPRGSLSEKELDEALLVKSHLPEYVFDFLDQFEEVKEKLRHFFGLFSRYYTVEIQNHEGFLRDLLVFLREVRLVLAAIRSKKLKRSIIEELQFEDFTDPLVAHILAQKDADVYEPPVEYQELKRLVEAAGEDPWEQYQAVIRYEFEKIEEMGSYPLFSINWILSYAIRLLLVEKWNELDRKRGGEILDDYKTG